MTNLREKVRDYIMAETKRKEDFADFEICCEEDNEDANEIIAELISEYSEQDCKDFLDAMERDADICEGGWVENGSFYPREITMVEVSIDPLEMDVALTILNDEDNEDVRWEKVSNAIKTQI